MPWLQYICAIREKQYISCARSLKIPKPHRNFANWICGATDGYSKYTTLRVYSHTLHWAREMRQVNYGEINQMRR